MPIRPEIPILHADDDFVVVNKPSGLVVHRGAAQDRVVVMSLVRDQIGQKVWPIHRLDRGTSGALCFALHLDALRVFRDAFLEQSIDKRYLAVVRGQVPEEGTIDYPLWKVRKGPRYDAVTDYRRLHLMEYYSIVEARPRTGRLHQIRRHFKHIDHPVVFDKQHGRGWHNDFAERDYGFSRLALHARELRFAHPSTGEPIQVVAPVLDLEGPLSKMGVPEELWR